MKMESHIKAPHDGIVTEILVDENQQLENGVPLLILDLTEDSERSKND